MGIFSEDKVANQTKTRLFLTIGFLMLCTATCYILDSSAQTINIGTVVIDENLISSNTFEVFSPKEVCYNQSTVMMNFSLTDRTIGTIGYSLDNGDIQGIQTSYVTDKEYDYKPFQNFSETNKVTVTGNLVFENLPNGNHTLRLYLGHQKPINCYEVEAFTEVNFAVKAPAVFVIQKQDCYTCSNIPLDLIISEPAWLRCSLDNAANFTITGNTTLTNLCSGYHNITVFAVNNAGGCCASNTISFRILENPDGSSSSDGTSIVVEKTQFPLSLLTIVVFIPLICFLYFIIKRQERRIAPLETE